jgi:hypothetical protein
VREYKIQNTASSGCPESGNTEYGQAGKVEIRNTDRLEKWKYGIQRVRNTAGG